MPKMPKWLGDFSEKAFKKAYKPTIVTEVEYYHKLLKRIRYQGEMLMEVDWKPAQEVEFRVTDTEYRHYTPLRWNSIEGYTDVLFYLHGRGPGSRWADQIKVGDEVMLIGPGGKFVMPPDQWNVVMLGDETTLSAFKSMKERLPHGAYSPCMLEMGVHALNWPSMIGLSATTLETNPNYRGQVLEDWLDDFLVMNQTEVTFFLSGNANTIKRLRKKLIAKKVAARSIISKPYWMEGKEGL